MEGQARIPDAFVNIRMVMPRIIKFLANNMVPKGTWLIPSKQAPPGSCPSKQVALKTLPALDLSRGSSGWPASTRPVVLGAVAGHFEIAHALRRRSNLVVGGCRCDSLAMGRNERPLACPYQHGARRDRRPETVTLHAALHLLPPELFEGPKRQVQAHCCDGNGTKPYLS